MNRALATVALVALAIGCRPPLSDGQYSCPDGVCPSPLVCWASTGFCQYGPDPGGGNDGGGMSPDAGATTCSAVPVNTCSGGLTCVVGAFPGPMPTLQCADEATIRTARHGNACTPGNDHDCNAPDACIGVTGSGSWCMRPCGPMNAPCGFGEDCITPAGVTDVMPRVCAPMCTRDCGTVPLNTQLTCSGSGYCLPPGW